MISNVRHPHLAGQQLIAGLWFPSNSRSEQETRKQILRLWQSGTSLYRFSHGDLLRLPKARLSDCDTLPGWPLRPIGESLASASFTKNEQAALPDADVWLVVGAQVAPLYFKNAQQIDPAAWIELDGYALYDTDDYSASIEPTPLTTIHKRDIREVLGDAVPPPSTERSAFLERLKAQQTTSSSTTPSKYIGGVIGALAAILAPLFQSLDTAPNRPIPQKNAGHIPARRQMDIRPQRWREWLSRVAVITRVSRLLGWRNAAYLRRMFKLFDDGDIREALRHAIPLGDDSPSRGQAFNTPRPREDLSLSSGLSPGVDMGLGEELSDYLRKLYRTIFQRLDRERRIDEAVFVLAELLQVRREAIDYLERHNRFAQAAELALSWDFSPDAIVRLLCLADKWDRAMEVARRDNAFSAAVLLLEKQRPLLAQRLRLKWATALVTQGEWLKAVEVIWPVEKARDVAAKWLKVAETGDGGLAARALVQRAILLPDTIERYADRLIALRDGPEAYARAEFAAALLAVKGKSAAMSKLARAILPQLLADRMQNANQLTRNELDLLIKLANDPLLKADLPPLQLPTLPEPIPLQDAPTPRKWSAPDSGLQPIVDIAYLRPNCFLIAQGDVGVAMIDSRGDTLQRYAIAADRLVIGDSGHVALALAKRDTVWRVARIDLVTHHVRDLGVLPLTHFATGFDGIAWTVVSNDRLLVLDTAHSLRDVLWHVSDLPGPVAALSRTPHSEHLVVTTPTGTELWGYQLPGRRLVGRDSMPEWVSPQRFARLTPTGDAIYLMLDSETSGGVSLTYNYGPHSFSTPLPGISEALDGIAFFLTNDWLVAGPSQTGRIDWFLIRLKTGKLCARISWPNHNNPRVTASSKNLYFFDSSGRILEISENSNEPLAIVLR